jgi:pentatricopeptide repeat protein
MVKEYKITPDTSIYNPILQSFSYQGDEKNMMHFYEEMKKNFVQPDNQTYHTIVKCYTQKGDFDTARKFLLLQKEQGQDRKKPNPRDHIYRPPNHLPSKEQKTRTYSP